MSLYQVAQVEFVDRFSPESTSVCHDFIRILRECMRKWIVNRTSQCQMHSSYCTYHDSSRALKTRELIPDIFAKFFLSSYISLHEFTAILTALRMFGCHRVPEVLAVVNGQLVCLLPVGTFRLSELIISFVSVAFL